MIINFWTNRANVNKPAAKSENAAAWYFGDYALSQELEPIGNLTCSFFGLALIVREPANVSRSSRTAGELSQFAGSSGGAGTSGENYFAERVGKDQPGKASVRGTAYVFDPETGEYVQRNFAVTTTRRGAN